jgi:ferredoxin
MPYVVTDACIQCGVCIGGCPTGAAQEGEGRTYIDPGVCIECGNCEQNCPVSAIIYVESDEEQVAKSVASSAGNPDSP